MLSPNRWWLPTVVGVGLTLAAPAAVQQRFTLQQVLSAPFPAQPVADPGGNRVAWVLNAEGVRNIWVTEVPDYQSRQVTTYGADDGQAVSGLAFTPDGGSVVYVRGGAPNRQGEIPNPLSEPGGAERAIWVVPVAGGEPRKLAVGSSPAVSPRGDVVAFLQRGQVWSVALEDSAKAEQLFEIRGNAGALRWSPDGSVLAFVSSRGDHGFLGVFHVADHRLRYLDPSVDRVGSPVWSPEGDRIAHLRVPNQRAALPFMPRREAEPWSIRVVTVATGEGREVWRAAEGQGARCAVSVVPTSCGAPETTWCFPGSATAGRTSIRSRGGAVRRPCSRRATSRSSTLL
jgi:Tol biopolymer transport system component